MQAVLNAGSAFFPLDEELGLLAGQYTPTLQESMVRLGAKLPYRQAQEEIASTAHTSIGEKTIRDATTKNGQACEQRERRVVEVLEKEAPEPSANPEKVLFSGDGAYVALTSGEWREVKTLVIGEFDTVSNDRGEERVETGDISYFSRSYRAREFERYALLETHRRGVENADVVVAVNDGADWLQGLVDYHAPEAVRILDFTHAQGYLAAAGKAWLGEGTSEFAVWFRQASHDLKHEPPPQTLQRLRELQQTATGQHQTQDIIAQSLAYLAKRTPMIDYQQFVSLHYPIGSGSVESGHKQIMQSRMKQAGMRWQPDHVDPMLTLRCLICNDRWKQGWHDIVTYRLQQRMLTKQRNASEKQTNQDPISVQTHLATLPPPIPPTPLPPPLSLPLSRLRPNNPIALPPTIPGADRFSIRRLSTDLDTLT